MVRRKDKVGRKRPWTVPGAPPPGDVTEVYAEVQGLLGIELWMRVRQTRLWAETPAERRNRLFARSPSREVAARRAEAANEAPPAIRDALRILTRVTAASPPDEEAVVEAGAAIAVWAQERGSARTAIHFAEVCGAFPRNESGAFVAARTNRIVGEAWRAEAYYRRAIRFAHRHQNWAVYVRASLGLGRLHQTQGRYHAAAKSYYSAARVALDEGEEWLAAQTYHDLLALHLEHGLLASGDARADELERARAYARDALKTYPLHHERFPAAVHDFAFLLVCEHRYPDALPLLESLMRAPIPMHDQVIGWSTLARAAGGMKDAERFADAESRVLELAPHHDLHAAAAYVNLAFGARALSEWTIATAYAARGIALAERSGDQLALHIGRTLLAEIEERRPPPPPLPPEDGASAGGVRELATILTDQLASWRGPTWTRREGQHGLATLGPV